MAAITITPETGYFSVEKDNDLTTFVAGQLRVKTFGSDEKIHLLDVNNRSLTAYVVNFADDTIDVNGTTSFANFATLLAAVIAVIHPAA